MLAIRFNRVGKKNRAYFRIALQEHTIAPGGKHIEILGSWNPRQKKGVFKNERIKYWLSKGAQPSDSVYNLLVKQGIIKGKKRAIKISKKAGKPEREEKPAGAEVKAEIKKEEAREEAKKEEPKKEGIKAEKSKAGKPEKEDIKKKEKIEEKKPEKAKPEEKK